MIGERISAISNMAALRGKICGYFCGYLQSDHALVGTSFEPTKQKQERGPATLAVRMLIALYFKFHEG
jgi:hypothetical protein